MPRFCILPYDSESDEEEVWMMEADTKQPAFCNDVNDRWIGTVDATVSPVVGFAANNRWVDATTGANVRDESWNEHRTLLKKKVLSGLRQSNPGTRATVSCHHDNSADDTEARWKQWNNNNSIAFADTLNTTLAQLNHSIQERVQIEREKLEQQYKQEAQELQILRDSLQILQIETSHHDSQESREEQNENSTSIPTQAEIALRERVDNTTRAKQTVQQNGNGTSIPTLAEIALRERVDNTTRAKETVPVVSPKKHNISEERKAAKETTNASESETTLNEEYLLEADNLFAKLHELQKTLQPFSKDKSASKRRLKLRKTVCGKLNTLTDSAAKVKEVAEEVSAAIQLAKQEDTQNPNMALGGMYILDLMSSNIMQRIQADVFNGSRGDGFPLAATIAQVAFENAGVIPVLQAHVYKACPMAIPRFPSESASGTISEDEFKQSLGLQRERNGNFESWGRFASRTENIIAMVGNIQSSLPATNSLFGGHQGAADWLKRFLESLPSTTPLPLLTAPVLHGFLSGAGCMLANQHEALFQRSLHTLSHDVLDRLDKGAIGKPSFTRLSKLLENGFDGFRSKVPCKAIPSLYNNGTAGAASTNMVQSPVSNSSTTGTIHMTSTPANIATVYPISKENVSADFEMTNAFDNDPITAKNTFSSPATIVCGNNMQFSSSAHIAVRANGWGAVHPAQGFGFGVGQGQLQNPFEAKQNQLTQTIFGKSSSIRCCQKAQPQDVHQKPKSTSQHSRSYDNKKKSRPPCKFFAIGKCIFGDKCKFSHENGDNTTMKYTKNNKNRNKKVGHSPFGVAFSTNRANPFA